MKAINRIKLEQILIDDVPDRRKRIWIWGTGNTSQLYIQGINRIELVDRICGYIDNDKSKWGGFNQKPVISPSELKDYKKDLVLICSTAPKTISAISGELDEMEMEYATIDGAILKWNKNDVLRAYDLLDDEESKNIYANIIAARIKGENIPNGLWSKNQYFAWNDFSDVDVGDVFVDCGAYVGDTLEKYIWERDGVFSKIYAFEPDIKNFSAMEKRVARLLNEWNLSSDMICLQSMGIGANECKKKFVRNEANRGLGSKFIDSYDMNNSSVCEIVSLDDLNLEGLSFLKADIESFEYDMLLGATESIRKFKPSMALAIYHNSVDLYSIILYIHDIWPDCKMSVRHHSPTLAETVLYVWNE